MPILSIFFLTLPNTTANQIGLYSGIGFIVGFLLEIPSGYISDLIGHKKALIISKVSMILSMLAYVLANNFWMIVLGSSLLSVSIAFMSGTKEAYMHNLLIELKREKDFTKIMSKMSANVSLFAAFLAISLPFFTQINMRLPLFINLGIDVLGLIPLLLLVKPKLKFKAKKDLKQLSKFFKAIKGTGFYSTSIFVGILGGFMIGISGYRFVYLQELGLPVILVGTIMGFSRFIWFALGNNIHHIEKFGIKKILFFEIFLFSASFILAAVLSNPYIVAIMFILINGYFWSRNMLIKSFFLKNFASNPNLKATMLSIKGQVQVIIQAICAFAISFVMIYSYKLGFGLIGVLYFILLLIVFQFIKKKVFVNA